MAAISDFEGFMSPIWQTITYTTYRVFLNGPYFFREPINVLKTPCTSRCHVVMSTVGLKAKENQVNNSGTESSLTYSLVVK